MRSSVTFLALVALASSLNGVTGSVFLPHAGGSRSVHPAPSSSALLKKDFSYGSRTSGGRRVPIAASAMKGTAMAIPGYGVAEQVVVGGFGNFLSIFNILLTGRILLSWIPQAQGVGFLQPLYQITDPYLNAFRGIIPPIGGLDLSPILAFFFLSFLGNATTAVGAEIPEHMRKKLENSRFGQAAARGQMKMLSKP